MTSTQTKYRSVVKATSIFGGVQIFQILINLIKAKFVALFLGAMGMGISSLFNSTLAIINSIAGLGLSYSATRDISKASYEDDLQKLDKIYTIFSRWIYFSSFLGVIILIFGSSFFSKNAFGNKDYTWAFVWLSISLLFNLLAGANNTLLQGTRRLKNLAKSSVIGSFIGLLSSIPLYYFFGIKGIVPALIFAAFTSYFLSYFFVRKIGLSKVKITFKQTISGGSEMVKLGIVMMVASLIGTLVSFTVNAFISRVGSISDVGLYNGGIAITSQFVSLVFAAMSVDYFPRLSAISSDNNKVSDMVNQQSEITMIIIFPLLVTLILTGPLLIRLLLTPEFVVLNSFIRIIAFGTIFQAAGYTISWIPLAKGEKKTFFVWNALVGNILGLSFFTFGYKFYGLDGLATAVALQNVATFFIFIVLTRKLYNYLMSRKFIEFLLISICIISLELVAVMFFPKVLGYSIGSLLLMMSIAYSLYHLNKLIGLKESLNSILDSFMNKRY